MAATKSSRCVTHLTLYPTLPFDCIQEHRVAVVLNAATT